VRKAFVLAAAVLALADGASVATAAEKGTLRPLSGSCETKVTLRSVPGAIPILLAVDVSCNMAHLGRVVGGTDNEIVIPTGEPSGSSLPIQIAIPTITYTAADGDRLKSTFAGQGSIDLVTGRAVFFGTETFIGGTGRFAGATGSSQTAGEASLATNTGFLTLSGYVSY
jgi:hypothetical protein